MRWDDAASDSDGDGAPSGRAAPSPYCSSGGTQQAALGLAESGGRANAGALMHGGCDAAVHRDADHGAALEPGLSDGSLEQTARSGSGARRLPVRPARASAAGKPPGSVPDVSAVLARTRARAGKARQAAGTLTDVTDSSLAWAHAAVVSPFAAARSSRAAQGAAWGLRPLTDALAGAAEAGMPSHGSSGSAGDAEFPTVRSGQSVASAVSAASEANGEGRIVRAAAASFWAAAADEPHSSSMRHNP